MTQDTGSTIHNDINDFTRTALESFFVQDYDEAIRHLKAAEVLDKYNPEILYNLGVSYLHLGLHKTALSYLYRVLALSSGYVGSLTVKKLIAFALIQTKEYNEALQYVREAIKDAPSDRTALNMGGYCHDMQGNHFDALKLYQHILSIDEDDINACNSMAYILAKTDGDLKEALKLALKAYKSNPGNSAYCDTIGYICIKAKKYARAEEYLLKALEIMPLSKEIREHLNELNRVKKAEKQ